MGERLYIFNTRQLPVITRIEPGWGSTAGEDTVTIFGSDFRVEYDQEGEVSRLPEVYFGGVKAVSVRWTTTTAHGKYPAYPDEGSVDVTVINPDAGVYTAKSAFEYRRSTRRLQALYRPGAVSWEPGDNHKGLRLRKGGPVRPLPGRTGEPGHRPQGPGHRPAGCIR